MLDLFGQIAQDVVKIMKLQRCNNVIMPYGLQDDIAVFRGVTVQAAKVCMYTLVVWVPEHPLAHHSGFSAGFAAPSLHLLSIE